jgi:hypothetical protein
MKVIKKPNRDGAPTPPPAGTKTNMPVLPSGDDPILISNVDRHRRRFTGGQLFLRELTYAVQLDEDADRIVLPRLRLQVLDNPPSWLPPRKRKRKRKSPFPSISTKKYLHSYRLRKWMRSLVEIIAGERRHLRVTMVQDPESAPLEWDGRCDSCGSTFWVRGRWSDSPGSLPTIGGMAFMQDCGTPDAAILTKIIRRRGTPHRRGGWLRIRKIAPPKY